MTVYSRSDLASVTVSAEGHGGCGQVHIRPAPGGKPVSMWQLDCPPCEDYLRSDPLWSTTIAEIPETHDQKIQREDFEKRGALDERKLMAMALAKLTGIPLPETIAGAITGQPVHIPGMLECPSGHAQPAGQKFCGECGAPMQGTVAQAAIGGSASPAAAPSAPAQASGPAGRPARLRDQNKATLKALCAARGLDASGSNADLVTRLSNAGVTSNDLAAFLAAAA